MPVLYDAIARLPLTVEGCRLEPLSLATKEGWTRCTTVVRLSGLGQEGLGEDVGYGEEDQHAFQATGAPAGISGASTLAGFSRRIDGFELFPRPTKSPVYRLYRRWAFESAALDLALRQNDLSLGEALGRTPRPVTFCVSMGLGDPPSLDRLRRLQEARPELRFKVDLSPAWTADTVAALAATGTVAVVDLKGLYRGAFEGPPPDAGQYRAVAEGLPEVWLEDPGLDAQTAPVLEPHRDRITWDANLHSPADLESLPFAPRCVNVKPSRFGWLEELLRFYELCEARGIAMYGGGQFELGPGRGQIQHLAGLFHPDGPNDVAPVVYHEAEPEGALPGSPLPPTPADRPGFRG